MREKSFLVVLAVLVLLWGNVRECKAEIAGDDAFSNAEWEQMHEEEVQGVVQSICTTEHYIITIENISDAPGEPDVVSAYYRNDKDENGNSVEPYTLARRVNDTNWEHGNGMAYNPNTGEIYVSLYTHANPDNRGSIFVMDPETLAYKRTIKISDDYNILGIGYKEETNQYVIQTDVDGGYSFKILDADFNIVEDLGQYSDSNKGYNFQDLEVSGDYIMNFPLTLGMGIGDFLQVYSISEKRMVSAPQLNFNFTNVADDEPESLCELEPGKFLSAVNVVEDTGARKIRFYKTEVPYLFDVAVVDENGETTGEVKKVLRGENVTVPLDAKEGYEVSELLVNGKKTTVAEDSQSYVLENIQQNQTVQAVISKTPFTKLFAEMMSSFVQGAASSKAVAAVVICMLGVMLGGYVVHIRMERKRKYLLRMKRRQEARRYASASRVPVSV